jgi:hypothetical protein
MWAQFKAVYEMHSATQGAALQYNRLLEMTLKSAICE